MHASMILIAIHMLKSIEFCGHDDSVHDSEHAGASY